MKAALINLDRKEVSGGMMHYCSQLANALAKTIDVTVILADDVSTQLFEKTIEIKKITPPKTYLCKEVITSIPKLINILKGTDADIIHMTSGHPWLSLVLPLLKKVIKCPIVTTLHDPKPHAGETSIVKNIRIKSWIRNSDKIFVHGKNIKNELLAKRIPYTKIEIIPHGDYAFFTKWKDDSIHEELSVLFFGRILDYKGIQYLLQAEPMVTKEVENAKIVIAGVGDFQKYDKYILNDKNFEIVNEFIPDEEVASLFQRCAVVILPYIDGSQSGIIPIAYSFKKPVITTNVGSIPEVVEDGGTGYIVEAKNPKALAEKIVWLLQNDDLRKQMGENAYKKMKEELSWDKIAEKTIEVYKEVIADAK